MHHLSQRLEIDFNGIVALEEGGVHSLEGDLVQGFDESATAPFGCGIVLVPWPNRVRDGRWVHQDAVLQLDLTEVDRTNAIHGLLRNTAYQLVEKRDDGTVRTRQLLPVRFVPLTGGH